MSATKGDPLRSESAEMAAAMVQVRAQALAYPGRWFGAPAGYQRQVAWKIDAEGLETVGVQREHLIPWRMDIEAVHEHLPPDLQIVDMEGHPDRRALYFTLRVASDAE